MDYIILCQDELPYFLLLLKTLSSKRDTIHFIVNSQALYERLQGQGVSAEVCSFNIKKDQFFRNLQLKPDSCLIISVKNRAFLSSILKLVAKYHPYQPTIIIEENEIDLPDQLSAKVLKPSLIFTELCLPRINEAFTKKHIQEIRELFKDKDRILLLIQSDPDPDAIASALAFRHLIGRNRSTAHIASFGEVTRPENLAMLRLLDIECEKITPDKIQNYDSLCMLDVQPPHLYANHNSNYNQCINMVDVVIDHHPEKPGYLAKIKDIKANYGPTSTILTEYLRAVDFNISQRLATALLYGIKSDPLLLGRGGGPGDTEGLSPFYPPRT